MIGSQLHHPDIHRPWSEWSEEQTLHLVAVYSNPYRWRKRRELFNDFIRHMRNSPNVKLYVVELAYGDRPHEVTGEDPSDVQLRTDCELWHKENLINVGVSRFPPGWKYGGYSDGDFHFTRHDWALEAIHMLQHHHFVQLFNVYANLTGETATSWQGHRPFSMSASFAWNYLHQEEFLRIKKEQQQRWHKNDSYYGLPLPKMEGAFPFKQMPGAPGGAWAWRRKAFDTVGGMLETCIVGGADWHMAFGLINTRVEEREMKAGRPYVQKILEWQDRAAKLQWDPGKSAIGCIDNFAVHHFHGSRMNRQYGDRWKLLVKHTFDPGPDLTKDWQGVLRWSGNKPGLRDDLRRYFITRNEDDPNLYGHEKPLA